MSKLSPINSAFKEQGINFNPESQKHLLKIAAQAKADGDPKAAASQEVSEAGAIPIANFKSNRLS